MAPPPPARIIKAIAETDRGHFITRDNESIVVGHSIPAVETLYQIFSGLKIPPSAHILQVGAGLGYVCAVLARVSSGVLAIEKMPTLVAAATGKVRELGLTNLEIRVGDGQDGAPEDAPFDLIVVLTPKIRNKSELLEQLAPKGQLIAVEYGEASRLILVKYTADNQGNSIRTEYSYIDFVPNRDEILIDMGIITGDILEKARVRSRTNNSSVLDEVRKLTNINEVEFYQSMSKRYGLALGNVEVLLKHVDPSFFDNCSRAFLDCQSLIPLYSSNGVLKVATSQPDASMIEIQKVFPEHKIEKILVTPMDYRRLWSALDICLQTNVLPVAPGHTDGDAEETDGDLLENGKPAIEAHLVSVFEALLLDAVAERASDIHIEQYHGMARIRLRVDGELRDLTHYILNTEELKGLVNVIKIRSDLNIAERRLPQGGRSRLRVGGSFFDLRTQVQPSLYDEYVVIRLLPQNSELISIESLGFSSLIGTHYRRLLFNPAGLVLVVGPTGSGKSTTLYAGLQILAADHTRKVITVEDPIEYSIDNIQQTRVRPDIGFSFADAMRSFVRQDPDVILIGEIRDHETALEAIRASQTGHVVLSTLHCNDAVDAMQRLYDLNIHPNSLASELLAVVAQRLAKRICANCRETVKPDEAILRELFPNGAPASFETYQGKGCQKCGGTGTHGRVAIVEYLQINAQMRNAISRQIPVGELRNIALDCGLITMRDSAFDHVIQGTIPLSELPRILPAERMAPEARWQWKEPT
jgi:type IV pilus assembly protein PilB